MENKQTVGMLMGIYNEAHRIIGCLEYHLPYLDQAVVVIQESDDGTEQVVADWLAIGSPELTNKVTVLKYPKMDCSEATLQFGADELNTDWILYVDADEKFPVEFLEKARDIVTEATVDGFWFERDNWFNVQIFAESVPIEPKSMTIKHPTRDRQFRLTRKNMSWFPPQVHVRCRVRGLNGNGTEEKTDTLSYHMYHLKELDEQWIDNKAYRPQVKLVNAMEKTKHGELLQIPMVADPRGDLYWAQIEDTIPFEIQRFFYITDIPTNAIRGGHANRQLNEVLIAVSGSVTVDLDDGVRKNTFVLDDPSKALYINKKTWINIHDFERNTILLCVCDRKYEPTETIRDYNNFTNEKVGQP